MVSDIDEVNLMVLAIINHTNNKTKNNIANGGITKKYLTHLQLIKVFLKAFFKEIAHKKLIIINDKNNNNDNFMVFQLFIFFGISFFFQN